MKNTNSTNKRTGMISWSGIMIIPVRISIYATRYQQQLPATAAATQVSAAYMISRGCNHTMRRTRARAREATRLSKLQTNKPQQAKTNTFFLHFAESAEQQQRYSGRRSHCISEQRTALCWVWHHFSLGNVAQLHFAKEVGRVTDRIQGNIWNTTRSTMNDWTYHTYSVNQLVISS